jgi:hypothetical protein
MQYVRESHSRFILKLVMFDNFFSVFLFFFFSWGNRYGCLAIRCLSFLLFVYLSWDLWTQLYI